MKLRSYQSESVIAIKRELERLRSTLLVLPTGAGKSCIVATLANDWPDGRTILLAHTEELVSQLAATVKKVTGQSPDVEQAERRALPTTWGGSKIVVGSIASVYRENRLNGEVLGNPDDFGLLVIDEGHRAVKKNRMYRKVIEHYFQNPKCKLLLVTATADRTDGKGLAYAESVAYDVKLSWMIDQGWLVPIRQEYGICTSIDFRRVRITAGEFNDADQERVMLEEKPLHEVAGAILEKCKGKKTLVFAAGIHHAERLAEILRERHGLRYCCVHGGNHDYPMDKEQRRRRILEFRNDEHEGLVGCDVFYEGFDCLDRETEILCEGGWNSFQEVFEAIDIGPVKCWSLNRSSGGMELVEIDKVENRPLRTDERMLTMESQHVNIRVTEGHEFHLKYFDSRKNALCDGWKTQTAREVADRSEIVLPISAEASFPGVPLSDDELRLVGWILTDGCMSGGHMSISQSTVKHHQVIRDLLTRLGFDFTERLRNIGTFENANPCYEFQVPKGTHSGSMKRSGWAYLGDYVNKDVSPLLNNMTRDQFKVMHEAAMLGNGSRCGPNKSGVLWLGRKTQADRLSAMAVIRGFGTSIVEDQTPMGNPVWRMAIRDRQFIRILPRDPRATVVKLETPTEPEFVWCVKNRNSTIVIRRRGKIAIVGNCPDITHVVIAKKTKSRLRYTQAIGRGTRILPDVYLDPDSAELRKAAIAASAKPYMTVIDLVGASTKLELELPCVADLLFDQPWTKKDAIERAKKKAMESGGSSDMREDVFQAESEIAREEEEKKRRAEVVAETKFEWQEVHGVGKNAVGNDGMTSGTPATDRQIAFLKRHGIDATGMTKKQAQRESDRLFKSFSGKAPTPNQEAFLSKRGLAGRNKDHASALIELTIANGWRPPNFQLTKDRLAIRPMPDGVFKAVIKMPTREHILERDFRSVEAVRTFFGNIVEQQEAVTA